MKVPKPILALFASLLFASLAFLYPLAAEESFSTATHMFVMGLSKAGTAQIVGDAVVFSSNLKARFVGIAFQHENFTQIHPMRRNQHGVFFLAYDIPYDMKDDLRYRLICDGAWCPDPLNPDQEVDPASGIRLSRVSIPFRSSQKSGLYQILKPGQDLAHFRFFGEPGERVCLTGSFNEWDPFMYELTEDEPGQYSIELRLPPGLQRYAFFYQGRLVADSLNSQSCYTAEGTKLSVLNVK